MAVAATAVRVQDAAAAARPAETYFSAVRTSASLCGACVPVCVVRACLCVCGADQWYTTVLMLCYLLLYALRILL